METLGKKTKPAPPVGWILPLLRSKDSVLLNSQEFNHFFCQPRLCAISFVMRFFFQFELKCARTCSNNSCVVRNSTNMAIKQNLSICHKQNLTSFLLSMREIKKYNFIFQRKKTHKITKKNAFEKFHRKKGNGMSFLCVGMCDTLRKITKVSFKCGPL